MFLSYFRFSSGSDKIRTMILIGTMYVYKYMYIRKCLSEKNILEMLFINIRNAFH